MNKKAQLLLRLFRTHVRESPCYGTNPLLETTEYLIITIANI